MTRRLDLLARWHGIPHTYTDAHGTRRHVPAASRRALLAALGADPAGEVPAAPAPDRALAAGGAECFVPSSLHAAPAWGFFCQLYELRSARNWGIGDFRDLAELARIAGQAGADFLGVNPLHALFIAAPERCSPFSPSNRAFLNPLYIAVDDVPGAAPPPDLSALRAAERVDYSRVGALKITALRDIFARAPFADDAARADHDSFVQERGTPLYRHAMFEALSCDFVRAGRGVGWTDWPDDYHRPDTPSVRAFAEAHEDEIAFHTWLQWIADRQLARVQVAARDAGMRIGLYLDLAVGAAPDGSSSWGGSAMLRGVRIGAPPDLFQTGGQDWGLAAFSPAELERRDFAPFRDMIRAQLAHAGALRIDHAMGLWQLFLIPDGTTAREGAYLRYPTRDMLRVLAEESCRARAIIVGEDLGSVPRGFRAEMCRAHILSYRLLYFEQDEDGFLPPRRYPASALACLSTHDLPTLADWWQGRDIEQREAFGLVDGQTSAEHREDRERERSDLVTALRKAGVLKGAPATEVALPPDILRAAHLFIARTPSVLAAVRLADLAGPQAATNVPGTTEADYPNWQLRSPTAIEDLPAQITFRQVSALLSRARPRPE
jgi:4-alpha-glucanotransferase